MKKIIIGIIPHTIRPPYPFTDYMITVEVSGEIHNMYPPGMDLITAANSAIMIYQTLEFIGGFDVRFSTLEEDKFCTKFMADYPDFRKK
ncbi:MAG: hypothetical protein ACI4Q5_00280 [Porcipelethomonas sp.]